MSSLKDKRDYWLWLDTIKGIGPTKRKVLLQSVGTPENLFEAKETDLKTVFGSSPFREGDYRNFILSRDPQKIEERATGLASRGIRFWTIEEGGYPSNLKRIEDAPMLLYYRGNYVQSKVTLAIVGTRQMSPYGKQVAEYLARELHRIGVHVVSGMARGIDSTAQRKIASSGGATTAVWGSGIDVCYPKEGKMLEEKILESKGAILSEAGPGIRPSPGLFPRRNRIISGLSDGVVVVEAKKRSGSLITADCALEQGRDVYAVPGRIFDQNSEGCNHLIRMGAKPVMRLDDLLEEYSVLAAGDKGDKGEFEKLLDVRDKMVYSCIQWSPVYIDDLIRKSKLPFGELQLSLMKLEIEGFVTQLPNQYYIRNG